MFKIKTDVCALPSLKLLPLFISYWPITLKIIPASVIGSLELENGTKIN